MWHTSIEGLDDVSREDVRIQGCENNTVKFTEALALVFDD